MTTPGSDLIATYSTARYEVFGEYPAVLSIGDSAGAHDEWLARMGSESAVVITAWNPFSHQLSQLKNDAANRHLVNAIEEMSLRWVAARGSSAGGGWHEDSCCVFDVPASLVEQWLVRYQQNAVVRVRRGGIPELVWHVRFHHENDHS
jgi:hypothetical protein